MHELGEDAGPELVAWADAQPRLEAQLVNGAIVERRVPVTVWELPRNDVHAVEAFLRGRRGPLRHEEGEVLLQLQDDPTAVLALLHARDATRRRPGRRRRRRHRRRHHHR